MSRAVVPLLVSLAWVVPAPARAYLVDANDARTVPEGAGEVEVQPVGYYQYTSGDGDTERYLLAPSVFVYLGLAEDIDLLLLGRGYALLGDDGPDYAFTDASAALRVMLRHGTYDTEGATRGPSLALQITALLPGWNDVQGGGLSLALLLSHSWSGLTLHVNAQVDRRHAATLGAFGTIAMEAFLDSPVRPVAELYVDVEQESATTISGMLGVNVDVHDRLSVMGGVRYGVMTDGARELEARLSAWVDLGG